MRVLIIKTSSMGDVIHTLPALTDAGKAIPGIVFDWVVEESFSMIPSWHPLVDRVIPVALRRWRKNLFSKKTYSEWQHFKKELCREVYDVVIDAQGLLKSAFLTRIAKGKRYGMDIHSAREPIASLFYQQKINVPKGEHAIVRLRRLMSSALNYPMPDTIPDYGLNRDRVRDTNASPYLVFLHGTTWKSKHWPETYWVALSQYATQNGWRVVLPWGSQSEQERAMRIASHSDQIEVLPKMNLKEAATVLASSKGVVSVDTGLGHLAAALNVPTVSLYGPTSAVLSGALGQGQIHLQSRFHCSPCLSRECLLKNRGEIDPPCFEELTPERVWSALVRIL